MGTSRHPPHDELTRRFYERHADEYVDSARDIFNSDWLAKFVEGLPGKMVLDVGTAGGRDARWFWAQGLEVVGIDYTARMIDLAEAASGGERIDFRVEDLRKLSFPDNTFDGAWCSCVLLHLRKDEIARALKELRRVLRPHGLLFVLTKIGAEEGVEQDTRYGGDEKFVSYFTGPELEARLEEAGFVVLDKADIGSNDYRTGDPVFFLAMMASKETAGSGGGGQAQA